MFYGRGAGFGRGRGMGRGMGYGGAGFGRGMGRGLGPNFSGVCRFNPAMPSRRAMMFGAMNDTAANVQVDEVEALKAEAAYLKRELDMINEQLKDMDTNE